MKKIAKVIEEEALEPIVVRLLEHGMTVAQLKRIFHGILPHHRVAAVSKRWNASKQQEAA